jgi:multidrug resistance efflux pump
MEQVESGHHVRLLAWILVLLLVVVSVGLVFTPWQQSVSGVGGVSALTPLERTQTLSAPVEGRVLKWHVTEGSKVKKGALIVELTDNDPQILDRIRSERAAIEERRINVEGRVNAHVDRLGRLEESRTNAINAALSAARNEQKAIGDDLRKVTSDGDAAIEGERATLNSARAEMGSIKAELQRLGSRMARQETLNVYAPRDGTVLRLLAQPNSELLKSGEPVAQFVPDSYDPTVEIWLNGVDMPLVHPGDLVRLQFNGWPAIQFVGWPSVAVGTFGGRVNLVDATDTKEGKFRILVVPDERDFPWPSANYLRQGVQAKAWVLLRQVPLGWELWRRFNGFPPIIAENEAGVKGAKEKKK